MESSPSSPPNNGASGSMASADTSSRLRLSTISSANACSGEVFSLMLASCLIHDIPCATAARPCVPPAAGGRAVYHRRFASTARKIRKDPLMTQAEPASFSSMPAAPRATYVHDPAEALLRRPGTLALFGFGREATAGTTDSRFVHVALPGMDDAPLPLEHWHVDAGVAHGRSGEVGWARGGGWLFARIDVPEAEHGDDIGRCAEHAYRALCGYLAGQPEGAHVQRVWNYLDRINEGHGDHERYKQFCSGRLRGMGDFFDAGFPAATAIGLPVLTGRLSIDRKSTRLNSS